MPETDKTLEDTRNQRARRAAQMAVEHLSIAPTGIVQYVSRGRVLVVGGEQAQWFTARIEAPLHAELLLTDDNDEPGVPMVPLAGRKLKISGYLGAFRIELGEQGKHNHQLIEADLVMDLGIEPLIKSELLPPGYWHFGTTPEELDAAWLALDGMYGTFEKPRYFAYNPDICAHSRSGQAGCNRCIEACPADAIISIGAQVQVNPNLCQGGGICTSVCPSGAMRYAYPAPADTAERLRMMLRTYLKEGGNDPLVVLASADDATHLQSLAANQLLLTVEELASVGHEIWLSALAWGARRVVLVDAGSVPGKARKALDAQVIYVNQLLEGMGYDPDALCLTDILENIAQCVAVDGLPAPASFAAIGEKRQLAMLATDHLWEHSITHPESVDLAPGAPYGQIQVDSKQCTLCMACTSVCPVHALAAGGETPRLVFREINCVQCGICRRACPESAITLHARLVTEPALRHEQVTLNEDPPFCCIRCGKPFATRKVLDNILDKLAGHPMFQTERARQRLEMCEDCRVIDAVEDTEAMQAGLIDHPTDNE